MKPLSKVETRRGLLGSSSPSPTPFERYFTFQAESVKSPLDRLSLFINLSLRKQKN